MCIILNVERLIPLLNFGLVIVVSLLFIYQISIKFQIIPFLSHKNL